MGSITQAASLLSRINTMDDLAHPEAESLPGAAGAEGRDKGRKGSTCKQLRPLPTFVKSQSSLDLAEKTYVRKHQLTEEEVEYNEKVFEETMAVLFPEEKMRDKFYRDKDKEAAARAWILTVIDEEESEKNSSKRKSSKSSSKPELEDLNFLLKSGIVLCRLIHKIFPQSQIDLEALQSGNLNTKKKNISQFLISALAYGLPERYLFKPDDVVVMAHFHKVRYSGSPEHCSPWRRGPRWTPTLLGSPSATQI